VQRTRLVDLRTVAAGARPRVHATFDGGRDGFGSCRAWEDRGLPAAVRVPEEVELRVHLKAMQGQLRVQGGQKGRQLTLRVFYRRGACRSELIDGFAPVYQFAPGPHGA
jgi:hypothetical protein